MLLFQRRFHEGLVSGGIDLTFRVWPTPRVKPGGRYRCHPIGVLEVLEVDRVRVREISSAEARRAGFANRRELVEYLAGVSRRSIEPEDEVIRVRLKYAGDGDRVAGAMNPDLTPAEFDEIRSKLEGMDARSGAGPWTREVLNLIKENPRTAASRLARTRDEETVPFKRNVVKLKKLGLTQSFEVGYELTPRGQRFLEMLRGGRGQGK